MSTDVPDGPGAGQPERGTRRPPRVGDSGSPVGSTLSIVLAVVAVVAGFLILRSIFDDDDGGTGGVVIPPGVTSVGGSTTTTEASNGGTGTGPDSSVPTSVTAPPKDAATVIVANASGVQGSAAQMTNALRSAGYTMAEETNGTGPDLDETIVYFVRGDANRGVAELVAASLGGVPVKRIPAEIPVQDEDIGDATVLVMLGSDTAGQALEDLDPEAVTPPSASPGGSTTTEP